MKRTILFRKAPLKPQKKPLQRPPMPRSLTGKLSHSPTSCASSAPKAGNREEKNQPIAETAHFGRVAVLPCAYCGNTGYVQAAHSNRYQDRKGAGAKAHYLATFPLCCSRPGVPGCHVEHDQRIGMTREDADVGTKRSIADSWKKLGVWQ
ncbi:MAG: hypothetical protein JWM30_2159 [Burkholderia sp.]|nr:hypothetical protein [Burkholderia sp.]